jgi:hypothetical protein
MAYRSGSALTDGAGETHDFTNRRKVVERSAILAPHGAPVWVRDRKALWERMPSGGISASGSRRSS